MQISAKAAEALVATATIQEVQRRIQNDIKRGRKLEQKKEQNNTEQGYRDATLITQLSTYTAGTDIGGVSANPKR